MRIFLCIMFLLLSSQSQAQQTLDYYIRHAKRNSPLLKDNQNKNEALEYKIKGFKAQYTKPNISLSGDVLLAPVYSRDEGNRGLKYTANGLDKYTGYESALTNGGLYQGQVALTQPLFNDVRYKTEAQQVETQIQINKNENLLGAHNIERRVTSQYLLCLQDHQKVQYQDTLLSFIDDQFRVVKQLARSGVAKISDVKLLDIEYNKQQVTLKKLKSAYRSDLKNLYILSGIKDTTVRKLAPVNLNLKSKAAASPFLKSYRLDSLNLIARQKVSELKYKPKLSLFTDGGLKADYLPTIGNRFGVSAGLTFTLPLYDGHQKALNRSRTKILLNSIQSYKHHFKVQNTVRKNKILSQISDLNDQLTSTRTQLQKYKTLLNYYERELQRGQLSVIDYLNTLRNFSGLQKNLALMNTQKQLLISNYNYWNW